MLSYKCQKMERLAVVTVDAISRSLHCDVTVFSSRQAVSALTSGLSRYSAQPTHCLSHLAYLIFRKLAVRIFLATAITNRLFRGFFLSLKYFFIINLHPRRCKNSSVGQSAGMLIPRSSVRFRQKLKKPENLNLHRFELERPSSKGTKLLLQIIKAIIIPSSCLSMKFATHLFAASSSAWLSHN